MTLKLAKPTGAKLNLRKTWQPMDPDAAAYITAVETADGQALEQKTKIAIDNFVLGCKADGIWSAIKASCILAGARTLNGALVPLVGTAPTNFNFVAGDYNRKTGLVGNGSTKYLDSNRAGNADPQNNFHGSIYRSTVGNGEGRCLSSMSSDNAISANIDFYLPGAVGDLFNFRMRTTGANFLCTGGTSALGFAGASRSASTATSARIGNTNFGSSNASVATTANSILVFARSTPTVTAQNYFSGRLAFYSIGESLNLALLDARVTDLINAFGAAIP
jgi:hypothetical protein